MSPPPTHTTLQDAVRVLLSQDHDVTNYGPVLASKRILLRADLNVPIRSDGSISDSKRITAVLPTIELLMQFGAKVVICSHFGRPNPRKQSWDEMKKSFSLAVVADALAVKLGADFTGLVSDCIGPDAQAAVAALKPGQACLLENTRFHQGDIDNDNKFARALGQLADVFVCDAFGVVHRDQGSVTGVVSHVPVAFPGPLIRHELRFLMQHLDAPVRPLAVIVGGAKVADKIGVLGSLIPKADVVLVGGRMAFTFLAAQSVQVGATQIEADKLNDAATMISLAQERDVQLLLPCDVRVSDSLDTAEGLAITPLTRTCCTADKPCMPAGHYGIDIGPQSEQQFSQALSKCKTIFWNGPMGKYEVPEFSSGTIQVARAVAAATDRGAVTIVGGGDSAAAVIDLGLSHKISHISTGGGASLELVEGRALPGLVALALACVNLQ